jgi:hypothetical protein
MRFSGKNQASCVTGVDNLLTALESRERISRVAGNRGASPSNCSDRRVLCHMQKLPCHSCWSCLNHLFDCSSLICSLSRSNVMFPSISFPAKMLDASLSYWMNSSPFTEPKLNYRVDKSPYLIPVMSHTSPPYFLKIRFNIVTILLTVDGGWIRNRIYWNFTSRNYKWWLCSQCSTHFTNHYRTHYVFSVCYSLH